MSEASALIQKLAQRAWKLIRDESYQNRHQPRFHVKGGLAKVREDRSFGTLEQPIGVNGALGEIAYLSLLRTAQGVPFAFHRLGSILGPTGPVDNYELLSIDMSQRLTLCLDPYYKKRSRKAPVGLSLAKDFYRGNPIFGINTFLDKFPVGISTSTREMQKQLYGVPLPIEALRDLEARYERSV
jgi:hypothetical protein